MCASSWEKLPLKNKITKKAERKIRQISNNCRFSLDKLEVSHPIFPLIIAYQQCLMKYKVHSFRVSNQRPYDHNHKIDATLPCQLQAFSLSIGIAKASSPPLKTKKELMRSGTVCYFCKEFGYIWGKP